MDSPHCTTCSNCCVEGADMASKTLHISLPCTQKVGHSVGLYVRSLGLSADCIKSRPALSVQKPRTSLHYFRLPVTSWIDNKRKASTRAFKKFVDYQTDTVNDDIIYSIFCHFSTQSPAAEVLLVQRFSTARVPLHKKILSCSSGRPFAVRIVSSSANLRPFMNSFPFCASIV